ncbi:MAG: hypothetical protein U0414_31040 [Polyangiaceae bacterium]
MTRPRPGFPGAGPTPPEGRPAGTHGSAQYPGVREPQVTYTLRSSRVEVHPRDGYLHIVATGTLASLDEVQEYTLLMERIMSERGCRRVMLDARGEQGEPPPMVRAAVWEWFRSDRSFDMVAYVVGDDESMKAARVNMTALSMGMNLRAFISVVEAHRFLSSPQRKASSVFASQRETNIPPGPAAENRPSSYPPKMASDRKASSPSLEAPRIPMSRKPTLTGLTRPTTPVPPSPPDGEGSGERPIYNPDEEPRSTLGGKPVNPRPDRGN